MKKKPLLTKGPNGPEVKTKHVQVLRGLAIRILSASVPEYDYIDGHKVPYLYAEVLQATMAGLKYNPRDCIPQMIREGYLVARTKDPDQVSFYILTSKKQGQIFKKAA
ncbi:hypothetical protein JW977_02275 [Candidatus Falkowbacteria bacterium]|nr:hypothetical protein [Candidatus Falkowbacteria bacterium]